MLKIRSACSKPAGAHDKPTKLGTEMSFMASAFLEARHHMRRAVATTKGETDGLASLACNYSNRSTSGRTECNERMESPGACLYAT